ncbi:glycosyltransferase family 39 protein [Chroococcidiopsis sp. TS-821]|uniref:glycosyltransferase family 39 protein n=1 Tax=Chroococcidiopsis sp. TS-821 TaxID=1378066 RepID=UPI000CEF214F|nr:glycosyltransferase family 39 protein [Chroococcidiopsis sp. TS-821]PPS39808.1 hypothetical protein B1A85_21640 [Chroococcidiopsis sp. TS-821]
MQLLHTHNQFIKSINKALFSPQRLPWTIISFGILVRLVQYLYNRSLWNDEAALALNIVNRSYAGLLEPLDYDQAAPVGFLFVERLATQLFGDSEYSLRLFPFLSAIIALFLFYRLAQRCLQPFAVWIALALFSSLHIIVYYATEVKQYSSDVAIAILACLLFIDLSQSKLNGKHIITYGILGAIFVWFSHSVVFVIAGIGVTNLIWTLIHKQKAKSLKLLGIYLFWLASFNIFYKLTLQDLANQTDLFNSWESRGTFPNSFLDISWLLTTFWEFFHKPLGFPDIFLWLAIITFFVGCISLIKADLRILLVLLSPILVTFGAAYLQIYPFDGRLVLFLTPFFVLLISEGAAFSREISFFKTEKISVLILILLLTPPIGTAGYLTIRPYEKQEMRPIMSYIKKHQKQNDTLYVYQRAEFQFKYYASKFGYQSDDYILGVDDLDKQDGQGISDNEWQRYTSDLNKLRGKSRVWIVFSHVRSWAQEKERITAYLDTFGHQIDAYETKGAYVYLYNLAQF